jgi:Abnormal spindle-like microcephaly-assoc'd, ASPM-SPD-2-Hydin
VRARVGLVLAVAAAACICVFAPFGSATPALSGPSVVLSHTSLTFPDRPVGTRSDAQEVTVSNVGDEPLTISTFRITGPDAADFGQGAECPVSPDELPAGASCSIYVSFSPDSSGAKSATLTIGDDAGSPQTVALSGSGTGGTGVPGATVSPGSVSFGDGVIGTKSNAQAVTLVNDGTAPLTISTFRLTGPDAGNFSQGADCPVSPDYLPAGASCVIYVAFEPDSTGAKSASLVIGDDGPEGSQTVALSGSGILGAGAVTLSPAELSFGEQLAGTRSDAKAVTVTNTGAGPLSISTFRLTGVDATDFAQGAACPVSPDTLASGASCTIYVSFDPSGAGAKSATLAVGDDAADSPQTVALSGTSVSEPQVILAPDRLSFGSVTVGEASAAQTVTLSDTGGGPLHLGSVGVTGAAGFSQTNDCPATLSVGSSCVLTVTFAPTVEGPRSGSLTIADDGAGGGQSLPLFGAGVAPGTYLSDDFESGSLEQWDPLSSPGSSIALDATTAHAGTSSVRFANSGPDEWSRLYADLAGGGHAQSYSHFCFRIAPGLTEGIEIANGRAITAEYPLGIRRWEITYNPYTQGLEAYFFNENLQRLDLYAANGQVQPGQWHCAEVYVDESLSGHAELWLDGASVGSVSGDLGTPSPYGRMYLWNQPSEGTVWFDDVRVASTPAGTG